MPRPSPRHACASSQEAMSVPGEEERLVRVHDVIQQLPPPHYR